MRTQAHKSHVIDDFIEELDMLAILIDWPNWRTGHLRRTDFTNIRKDVLERLHEVIGEARRRLENA